jgi:hypothetical protein
MNNFDRRDTKKSFRIKNSSILSDMVKHASESETKEIMIIVSCMELLKFLSSFGVNIALNNFALLHCETT